MAKKKLKLKKLGKGGQNKPIFVSDPKDKRLQAYNDSLDLYNSYTQLRKNLTSQGYSEGHIPKSQILDTNKVVDYAEGKTKGVTGIEQFNPFRTEYREHTYEKVQPKKERENIYSVSDLVPGQINNTLGRQLFSTVIKPTSIDSYTMPFFKWNKHNGDGRIVFNYENVNPVQPIIYKPEENNIKNSYNEDWVKNAQKKDSNVGRTTWDNPKLKDKYFKSRYDITDDNGYAYVTPKIEQPINIQSSKPDLLQGNNQQLEFNPIPFKKGTYFTRQPQQQEIGKTQYYDKSGKLLGEFANGGTLTTPKTINRPEFYDDIWYPDPTGKGRSRYIDLMRSDPDIYKNFEQEGWDGSLTKKVYEDPLQQMPFHAGLFDRELRDVGIREWNSKTPDQQQKELNEYGNGGGIPASYEKTLGLNKSGWQPVKHIMRLESQNPSNLTPKGKFIKRPITEATYNLGAFGKADPHDYSSFWRLKEENGKYFQTPVRIENNQQMNKADSFFNEYGFPSLYNTQNNQWTPITKTTYDLQKQREINGLVPFKYGGEIQNELDMKKSGGKIKIKPSKKGTFTAAATKHGKGVQEFASQVLANKENYSPAMVKKAVFAKNSSKWKKGEFGTFIGGAGEFDMIDPTFGIGDQGYQEQLLQQGKQLGDITGVENPYAFNPSLTQSLERYAGDKAQLNPQEQGKYTNYLNQQRQPALDFANQLKSQIPANGMPDINPISSNKYFQRAGDKMNQAMKKAQKIGETWSNFASGMGSKENGGTLYYTKLPKFMGGGANMWGAIADSASYTAGIAGDVGAMAMNQGKGILDILGNQKINKETRQYENDLLRQSMYYDQLNSVPIESKGYGTMGRNPAFYEFGGITDYKTYTHGGANVETENLEVAKLPNGLVDTMYGKTHNDGGIPMNLPQDTKILSEKLKLPKYNFGGKTQGGKNAVDTNNPPLPEQFRKYQGKSYASVGKKFETKKDFDHLDMKGADDVNNSTANLNIALKNLAIDNIFALQEMDKVTGKHGKKIQSEALNDYQMKFGGEVQKAQEGYRILDEDVKKKAKKSSIEQIKQKGLNFIDEEGNRVYYGKDGQVKKEFHKGSPEFDKAFGEARKQGLKQFTWKGKKYGTELFKPSVETVSEYAFTEPELTLKAKQQAAQEADNPLLDKTSASGFKRFQGTGKLPNLNFVLPNTYERLPLSTSQLNPQYIDPRYLDISRELADVNRGVNAFSSNIGDRTSSNIGNLLQAQSNAYNQKQRAYQTKYNYDRQQDSQAQQFNAQSKMNIDQVNLNERNRFLDQIQRREGAIDTQKRLDYTTDMENMYAMNQESATRDFIDKIYPWANSQGLQYTGASPYNPYEDLKNKAKTRKNGGKVKMKLKNKKK